MAGKSPDFTEHTLSSRTVYRGQLLHVLEDRVSLPDGRATAREYIRHPGAVMIAALADGAQVLLERQFRYALQGHFYELPAGKMEPGEDPLATAQRELAEETGYRAEHWRHLATLHPCLGYSDERIELYLARGLTHVGHARDDEEFLEVLLTPLAEALRWVKGGRISDIKTMIGLMWAEKIVNDEW